MPLSKFLSAIAPHIKPATDKYIGVLSEFIAFRGISQQEAQREELVASCNWLADQLRSRGGQVKLHPLGPQPGAVDPKTGGPIDLPPVITAAFGDPSLPTLLAYCHYDVQPALKSDGWESEPFTLTIRDGPDGPRMYGRGTTDDKGPIICWLWALDALKAAGVDLPVRLVLCFEGFEEHGSVGLDKWVAAHVLPADGTASTHEAMAGNFSPADPIRPSNVVITDNYWLAPGRPAVTHALRGNCYFHAKVTGPNSDLHSGVHGGPTFEPLVDMMHLFSKLVTPAGEILVPGILDDLKPLTAVEEDAFRNAKFDTAVYAEALGYPSAAALRNNGDKFDTLMSRWRRPTLSFHGVEGAFYEPGAKTVIPGTVIGKFSIRTVPNMEGKKVGDLVTAHCANVWKKLGTPNKLDVKMIKSGAWFYEDPSSPAYSAAAVATEAVWGIAPDFTCEGGSIPIASAFRDAAKAGVVLLPLGAFDDGAHAQNEKLSVEMFTNGAALVAAFMFQLAEGSKAL